MSNQYSGEQTYEFLDNISDKLDHEYDLWQSQISDIDDQLRGAKRDVQNLAEKMAKLYLQDRDLNGAQDRYEISELTHFDVDDELERKDYALGQLQLKYNQIEENSLYQARSFYETEGIEDDMTPNFANDELDIIVQIEQHPGFMYLERHRYLDGEHDKGFLGFEGKRLDELAQVTAESLNYHSFIDLIQGESGLITLRENIPGLDNITVLEAYEELELLIDQKKSLDERIRAHDGSIYTQVLWALTEHITNPDHRLSSDGTTEMDEYIQTLENIFEEIDSLNSERNDYRSSQSEIADLRAGVRDVMNTFDHMITSPNTAILKLLPYEDGIEELTHDHISKIKDEILFFFPIPMEDIISRRSASRLMSSNYQRSKRNGPSKRITNKRKQEKNKRYSAEWHRIAKENGVGNWSEWK